MSEPPLTVDDLLGRREPRGDPGFHPSEHRAYRELYASAQHLATHWGRLAERLADVDPRAYRSLREGAEAAADLLDQLAPLTEERGLYGVPMARGVGRLVAGARNVVLDRFLERNQALRIALLDAYHVRNLLAYLGRLGEHRGSEERAAFCRRHGERLARVELAARVVVVAEAGDPDRAISPLDRTPAGDLARRITVAIGALGEWIDRQAMERARAVQPAPAEPDEQPAAPADQA